MEGYVEVYGDCRVPVRRRSLELEAERRVFGVLSSLEFDFEYFVVEVCKRFFKIVASVFVYAAALEVVEDWRRIHYAYRSRLAWLRKEVGVLEPERLAVLEEERQLKQSAGNNHGTQL